MPATNQGPFLGVPEGDVKSENPDGITWSNGGDPKTNLGDASGHPALQSGDWQSNWRPGLQPRGRP